MNGDTEMEWHEEFGIVDVIIVVDLTESQAGLRLDGQAQFRRHSISDELGNPITYVDLPVEHWREVLVERAGMPEFLATHLAAVAIDHQNGVFSAETDIVARIGGKEPQSLVEFIRTHKSEFSSGPTSARAA